MVILVELVELVIINVLVVLIELAVAVFGIRVILIGRWQVIKRSLIGLILNRPCGLAGCGGWIRLSKHVEKWIGG
jgi:hypothetical protein